MSKTSGSNQFIRLDGGGRALYCAYDFSLHHPSTDQTSSGVFSYKLGKWFSSFFNYSMYMYEHGLGPYEDPKYRAEVRENMERTAARCCPKEIIEDRQIKYNLRF